MKLIKIITGIFGCALATGLMAFVPAHAGAANLVISNALYVPIGIAVKMTYVATNNNNQTSFKTVTIDSRQALKALGYPANVQLAAGPSADTNSSNPDIYVIDTKAGTVATNLTLSGNAVISLDNLVSTSAMNNNGSSQFKEQGLATLHFQNSSNVASSTVVFDLGGNYSANSSGSATNNGTQTISQNFSASTLSGEGVAAAINSNTNLVTGKISGSGSGRISP